MRLILFIIFFTYAYAQAGIHKEDEVLTFWRTHQEISLDEVRQKYLNKEFKVLTEEERKLGFGGDSFWFHYSYENRSDAVETKVFVFTFYLLDYIDIFELENDRLVLKKLMGNMRPNAHYGLSPKPAYTYTIGPKERKDFFIKVRSLNVVMENEHLDYNVYVQKSMTDSKVLFFYFGAMLIMILYNFVIFTYIKNRSYFYYVMYHLFLLIYLIAYTNVGYSQIWTSYPKLNDYLFPMVLEIFVIFGTLFAMSFLDIKSVAPRIYKLMQASIFLNVFVFLLSIVVSREISLVGSILTSLLSMVLLFYTSLFVYIKKLSKNAPYYLGAWIFMFLGGLGTSVENFVNAKDCLLIKNALFIGSFLEVLLLSLGLAAYYSRLRKEKDKAEAANTQKSTFLANMSHEIRTPMNGILGFVDILAKDETQPKRQEYFEHIKSAGRSLLTIINDILDFSKIETGKLTLEVSPFSTKELLEDLTGVYETLCSKKGIFFTYHIQSSVPNELIGDKVRIKQIILNLMNNAYKFTPSGKKIDLNLSYDTDTEQLCCRVADTGIGIKRSNLAKIFNPFEQEDVSTTRQYGGTGLGLAISSEIVAMMGGHIEVESEVDKGSTFFFCIQAPLPVSFEDLDVADDTILEEHYIGKALIVEDNKTNQMLLSIYLDSYGVDYDIANDGLEGVTAYETSEYDLIFMDENMPNMNGIEATYRIRDIEEKTHKKMTPIIAVTANALKGDKERFLNAGMNDYVSKPYGEKDIVAVLQRYLKKRDHH